MRVAVLLFLVCLAVDFSDPLLPGSVRASDAETVHADQAPRLRLADHALRPPFRATPHPRTLPPAWERSGAARRARPAPAAARNRRQSATALRLRSGASDPGPASAEDH